MSDEVGDIMFAQHDFVDQLTPLSTNGIYFGKNIMNPLKIDKYKLAKEKGFQIVHLDEEGGVYQGQKPDIESILDTRLNVSSMDSNDYVFTWGQFQADHYRSRCEKSKQPTIKATGHIRFDLLKKKYGNNSKVYLSNYALSNTNGETNFFEFIRNEDRKVRKTKAL